MFVKKSTPRTQNADILRGESAALYDITEGGKEFKEGKIKIKCLKLLKIILKCQQTATKF